MNADVEEVTSYATQSKNPIFAAYEYQTSATTLLRFSNGAVGKSAAIVDCIQPYYFHTHLVGSEGSLLDNKFHSNRLGGLDKGTWSQLSMRMLDSGDVHDHPYQTQFHAFFQSLRSGADMPLTSFKDAFQTHRVIAAADLSAAERRAVKVSEIPMH
jgi:predicted dehydrogenase